MSDHQEKPAPIHGQFRFAAEEKVYWPATVVAFGDGPDDARQHEVQWLVSLLKRIENEKLIKLQQRERQLLDQARTTGKDVTEASIEITNQMAALVAEHVHGWRGFVGEDGTDLPYTPENKAALLDNYRLFQSALISLFAATAGAIRKNSSAGAGG